MSEVAIMPFTDRREKRWRTRTITWRGKRYTYRDADVRNSRLLPNVYVLHVTDEEEDVWWILHKDNTLTPLDINKVSPLEDPSILVVFAVPEDEEIDALDAYRLAKKLGVMP